jgi:tetratricopeptide (TPR) repeat protein
MKFAFLKTRVSVVIIGLVLGLVTGFKIANTQYRREQGLSLNRNIAQASGRLSGSESVNSSSSQNLTPEQRDQIINQVRMIIDKAKNNPGDIEAQLDAAYQFIQIGRPEEALQFLQQANKVKPDDARTTAGMGMASFMMGKYDEAITWSKRSLDLTPKNPGATFLLIASYIRSNSNLNEAERLIKQLEAEGMDKEMIAKAREELNAVRSDKTGGSGSTPNSRTMLDHGPSDQKKGQEAGKTGGRP